MFLEELDSVDGRDLMTPDTSKWLRVSQHVMSSGYSPCLRDGPACKTKWNQLIPDYKRIADYMCRTGRNVTDFWELDSADRKAEGLPRQFSQDIFNTIHEWFGQRPQIQPPHVRDLLSPTDVNYSAPQQELPDDNGVGDSEPDTDDPFEMSQPEPADTTEDTTPPRSPLRRNFMPAGAAASPGNAGSPSSRPLDNAGSPSGRPFNGVPAGIMPQVLSSSENSLSALNRRPGNTGVRRKNVSGHTVIAEATKTTGAVMATQMQTIAEASRELERSKIEVQLKLFSEQMEYQREKDRRMYEHAAAANENAR